MINPLREMASQSQAERAIRENLAQIDPAKYTALHNLTVALSYLVQAVGEIRRDQDYLSKSLQPVLKAMQEDNDWHHFVERNPDPR